MERNQSQSVLQSKMTQAIPENINQIVQSTSGKPGTFHEVDVVKRYLRSVREPHEDHLAVVRWLVDQDDEDTDEDDTAADNERIFEPYVVLFTRMDDLEYLNRVHQIIWRNLSYSQLIARAIEAVKSRQLETLRGLVHCLTSRHDQYTVRLINNLRDRADETEQLEYVLAVAPIITLGDIRMMITAMSAIVAVKHFHELGLISGEQWYELIAHAIEENLVDRLRKLWQIRMSVSQERPSGLDHALLRMVVARYLRTQIVSDTTFQAFLGLDPAWTVANDDLIFYHLTHEEHDRGELCQTTDAYRKLALAKWFAAEYAIDLTKYDYQILFSDCSRPFATFLTEYTKEYPVYYCGAQIQYYAREEIRWIVCRERLPIQGWFSFQIQGRWIYSLEVFLDLTDSAPCFRTTTRPLRLTVDREPIDVYPYGPLSDQMPVFVTPPDELLDLWEHLCPDRKSARSVVE